MENITIFSDEQNRQYWVLKSEYEKYSKNPSLFLVCQVMAVPTNEDFTPCPKNFDSMIFPKVGQIGSCLTDGNNYKVIL